MEYKSFLKLETFQFSNHFNMSSSNFMNGNNILKALCHPSPTCNFQQSDLDTNRWNFILWALTCRSVVSDSPPPWLFILSAQTGSLRFICVFNRP